MVLTVLCVPYSLVSGRLSMPPLGNPGRAYPWMVLTLSTPGARSERAGARPGTNPGTGTAYHATVLTTVGPCALPVPGFVPGTSSRTARQTHNASEERASALAISRQPRQLAPPPPLPPPPPPPCAGSCPSSAPAQRMRSCHANSSRDPSPQLHATRYKMYDANQFTSSKDMKCHLQPSEC